MDISCMKLLQHLTSCTSQTFSQCILRILAEDGPVSRDREAVRGFFRTHLDVAQANESRKYDTLERVPLKNRQHPHQHFSSRAPAKDQLTKPVKSSRGTATDIKPNSESVSSWSSARPMLVTNGISPTPAGPEAVPRTYAATPCDLEAVNWVPAGTQYERAYDGTPEHVHSEAYRGLLVPQVGAMHNSWSYNLHHAHEGWGWPGVDVSSQSFQY